MLTSVAATLVCVGLLFAVSFGWLFAVLLLLNVFWCAALPLVEATTFGRLKGRLGDYGRIRVWGSVSFVLAVLATGPALDRAGVGILPAVLVVLFALVAVSAWLLPADEAPAHHEEHASLGRILRRPEVAALFVACFLMSLAHGPYNSFYSIHLVDLGYSKTAVSWLWTISVVAEIGVFLWMPHLLRRVSIANVIAVSLGCAVVRFLLIGWLAQVARCAGRRAGAARGDLRRAPRGRAGGDPSLLPRPLPGARAGPVHGARLRRRRGGRRGAERLAVGSRRRRADLHLRCRSRPGGAGRRPRPAAAACGRPRRALDYAYC